MRFEAAVRDHNQRGSKQSASWLRLAGVPPRSGRWMVVLHSALYALSLNTVDLAKNISFCNFPKQNHTQIPSSNARPSKRIIAIGYE